jgi:hypothetical protein
MNDESEAKQCSKCGKKLRAGTSFSTCTAHRTDEERREAWRRAAAAKTVKAGGAPHARADGEGDVLDRLGFGKGSDEHPRVKPPPKPKEPRKPATSTPRAPAPSWQERFRTLAAALGLDAEKMLEEHCRRWVESTKARALDAPLALPASIPAPANGIIVEPVTVPAGGPDA